MRWITAIIIAAIALTCTVAANAQKKESAIERNERLANEAGQRAARNTVEPNEIEMIKYRRILNGKPGAKQYVVLLSKGGQPIDYFVADGKCTSSHKRLTPTHRLVDKGPNALVVKAPSEDGTFGSSASYIYCKTADGKYKDWNGNYYVSDAPIELTIKPLVIDLSGRNQQQQ